MIHTYGLVLLLLYIGAIGTICSWILFQSSIHMYVLYKYVQTVRAKATPRMRAGADFGFIIVTLAYAAVIAANKYGPDLLEYITAHWDDCVKCIYMILQVDTANTHELLMRIQQVIPQIVQRPELQQFIVLAAAMRPDELFQLVLQLGNSIQEYGVVYNKSVGLQTYTHILAAKMQLEYAQLLVSSCSDWAQYFTSEYQIKISKYIVDGAQRYITLENFGAKLYNNTKMCGKFINAYAPQLDDINMKYKIVCEITKAYKDILCPKST